MTKEEIIKLMVQGLVIERTDVDFVQTCPLFEEDHRCPAKDYPSANIDMIVVDELVSEIMPFVSNINLDKLNLQEFIHLCKK